MALFIICSSCRVIPVVVTMIIAVVVIRISTREVFEHTFNVQNHVLFLKVCFIWVIRISCGETSDVNVLDVVTALATVTTITVDVDISVNNSIIHGDIIAQVGSDVDSVTVLSDGLKEYKS